MAAQLRELSQEKKSELNVGFCDSDLLLSAYISIHGKDRDHPLESSLISGGSWMQIYDQ